MELAMARCDLCKKPLNVHETSELGKWVLHPKCYQLALKRLKPFIDLIFGPEDEWKEWLQNEN